MSVKKQFVLEAFDRTLWCPVAEAMFEVPNVQFLREALGESTSDDPELTDEHIVDCSDDLALIEARYGKLVPAELAGRGDIELRIYRQRDRPASSLPYLGHTGYELPLLLDGRKKLAKMYHEYPPRDFPGEDSFDRWVSKGYLHKEVMEEPFVAPRDGYEGLRVVYYTLKGDEWRIPAMKLIWRAAEQSGGWNEHFERLEGMLFGYEDWQNDWWSDLRRQHVAFRKELQNSSSPQDLTPLRHAKEA